MRRLKKGKPRQERFPGPKPNEDEPGGDEPDDEPHEAEPDEDEPDV
jgi:hypothetical protein